MPGIVWDAKEEFQSTCLREARPYSTVVVMMRSRFQSTCLREARPGCRGVAPGAGYFNPRAYVRHDRWC